jgi:hypothetical protein
LLIIPSGSTGPGNLLNKSRAEVKEFFKAIQGPGWRMPQFPEVIRMAPATRSLSETDLIEKEKT